MDTRGIATERALASGESGEVEGLGEKPHVVAKVVLHDPTQNVKREIPAPMRTECQPAMGEDGSAKGTRAADVRSGVSKVC